VVAEQVAEELGLERVIFVPGGILPHKDPESVSVSVADRLRMVEKAVAGNDLFTVDPLEIEAGRKIYSVETVRILKEREPHTEWYFISGADEVANLLNWKAPDELLAEAYMVAATRPGYELSELDHLKGRLENFHRIVPVECTRIDISATEIRERARRGKSVRYLVPEGVYRIVRERGLYDAEGVPEGGSVSGRRSS
jgi:nicotinate-nucleotide adenylyltransferase